VQAYNGGTGATTISLACAGNQTRTLTIPAGQLMTLTTGWANPCSGNVTVGSTNGWSTNFDNIVLST
jgi:hypothetical protein